MANQAKKHFLAEIEEGILSDWERENTFEKSLEIRSKGPVFNFYDGPPFANGSPHYGHLEQTTIKDTVTRYKTMRGYYVPRTVGWDTHGLPVEYEIEKKHGFKGKKDIVSFGIDKFNKECRESVYLYKDVWEKMFTRVGRWADYSKTYSTLDENYIESVWWTFKSIFDKDLVYKDFRSSPYCPRCATPVSNFELNLGYQDNIKDPSLFVKFKLTDQDAFLLGWTTTPWSLPGNAAIAVKPEAEYVYVELEDDENNKETLVLARNLLSALSVETYTIKKELFGKDLIGLSYEPLFKIADLDSIENNENLYKVWGSEAVSIDDGSGVLHVAPAFGEDDLMLGKQHNIPVLITVDENGHIKTDMGLPSDFAGKFFKQADNVIIEELTKSGNVYAAEHLLHTYPFCWRCDTPLLYYATDSWLVRVTQLKEQLVNNNQEINWTPKNIKDGRFGKWLEQVRDWAISRNRFWGAPLPVWVTDDGEVVVVGSIEELKAMAVDPSKVTDLHRPYIDEVVIKTKSGKLAHRIPEVFDCWFESGSMPYAQNHYPFNPDGPDWDKTFPADFIAEAVDQTRGWFYTLHVLATALFDKPAFKNAISSGWIVAADGEKLSKRKKNYAPMDDVFDQYGVDTLRYFLATSPLVNGEDTRFSVDFLRDVQRKVFMTLFNTYTFFELYAQVDGWKAPNELRQPESTNVLDQWMIARVNQTIKEVTEQMEKYRLDKAARPINDLLDDLSNWYVRRSRRRFWKSQDDLDKQQAYLTLHYCLMVSCQMLAPFSPFLSDYIWRKLAKNTTLPTSVHLSDWPKSSNYDNDIIEKMSFLRDCLTIGLAQRAAVGIKVRQPLAKVTIYDQNNILDNDNDELSQLVAEELNVKEVEILNKAPKTTDTKVVLDINIDDKLRGEGMVREVVRFIQNARKQAGLNVDDRIDLQLTTTDRKLEIAIKEHTELIKSETLAVNLNKNDLPEGAYQTNAKFDNIDLDIALSKTGH